MTEQGCMYVDRHVVVTTQGAEAHRINTAKPETEPEHSRAQQIPIPERLTFTTVLWSASAAGPWDTLAARHSDTLF